MKRIILLLFLCNAILNVAFAVSYEEYFTLLSETEDYEQTRKKIIIEINSLTTNTNEESFKKNYLLSLCCLSTDKEVLDNGNTFLTKSIEDLKNIDEKSYNEIESYVCKAEVLYWQLADFSVFTYDDFGNAADSILNSFKLKVNIVEKLSSYQLILSLKDSLSSFQKNIMKEKERKVFNKLMERLNRKQNSLPEILEKQTIKG